MYNSNETTVNMNRLQIVYIVSALAFFISATIGIIIEATGKFSLLNLNIVFHYLAIATFLVLIIIVGVSYPEAKSKVNTAIIAFLIYVVMDILFFYVLDLSDFAYIGVFLFYAIVRGVAYSKVNKTLKAPNNKLGSFVFPLYGWSLAIFFLLYVIFFAIALFSYVDWPLVVIVTLLIVQMYFESGCFAIFGLVLLLVGVQKENFIPIKDAQPVQAQPVQAQPVQAQPGSFCPNCGQKVDTSDSVCSSCGYEL